MTHRRSPVTMSIAFELPNHQSNICTPESSEVVVLVLVVNITRKVDTGGTSLHFEPAIVEMYFGDSLQSSYAVSRPLKHSVNQLLSTYISVLPPNNSWSFLGSDDSLEHRRNFVSLELQRLNIEHVGTLYLTSSFANAGESINNTT